VDRFVILQESLGFLCECPPELLTTNVLGHGLMTTSKKGMASEPSRRTSIATKPTPRSQLLDLFQWFAIAPTPLHELLQNTAIEAGWIPPWELEKQALQKKKAGKKSGISRGGLRVMRRALVYHALEQLNPPKPYSNASFQALRTLYDHFLTRNKNDPDPILSGILSALTPADIKHLREASDDTLLADLKAIRKSRGKI
jgi:hypothetical protein